MARNLLLPMQNRVLLARQTDGIGVLFFGGGGPPPTKPPKHFGGEKQF